MNETTFAELAAGYALNALSPAETTAFESALAEHPEWEKHLRAEVDTVALLSDSIEPVRPPAAVRDALLARIAVTPQSSGAVDPIDPEEEDFAAAGPAPVTAAAGPASATGTVPASPPPAGPAKRRWFTLAASIVVLLALGFGSVVIAQQLTRPATVVALEQIENAPDAQSASVELTGGGEATAHWSSSLGEVVLVSEGLPALPEDQTFELWFVRGEQPVSAGTFAADEGAATAVLTGTYEPGDVIAVTVEPAGGSPSGLPTSDPIVAIATA